MLLVTGGAGFIGSNFITEWFRSHDESILTLDALTYAGNKANLRDVEHDPRHRFVEGNILDEALVADLFDRLDLAQKARRMILSHMKVEAEDETSLTLDHRGYYMQISFSPLHPLLVVCLAKAIRNPDGARKQQLANELNLHSVLGSHAINEDVGCYSYRATHWLDTELTPERFFEILSRCVDEADRGYFNLAG